MLKLLNKWGMLFAVEGTYGDGSGGALNTTVDALLVQEQPDVALAYGSMGARRGERGPMNLGQKRVAKQGRSASTSLIHEAAGGGAAYSSSVVPSLHAALQAAGFDAALDASGGSEKYTYTIGTGSSGVAEIYTREQKYVVDGIYNDLTVSLAEEEAVPVWDFMPSGLLPALPTEVAVPAITYPTVSPAEGDDINLELGDFATAVVRNFTLALNREITPRTNKNIGGHSGFAPGARRPTLEVVIEVPALVSSPFHSAGGLDAYELADRATDLDLALAFGTTQYAKWSIAAPAAQLVEPIEEQEDGPTALWRLMWELNPSTPAGTDNLTITFD